MSKYKVSALWKKMYGEQNQVYDYAGRLMKRAACGNPNSRYAPTMDHVRPLACGGQDVLDNIIVCHRNTNLEKAAKFPHWKTNNQRFHAVRRKGSRVAYRIKKDET